MAHIEDARILVMATDGFEQRELKVPVERLRMMGAVVEIAAPNQTREPGRIRGWNGEGQQADWGEAVIVDRRLSEVNVDDYDALVIPGGQINPDKLRLEPLAVDLVRRFVDEGKVVAAICHGPWLLVEADVLEGRRVTSWKSLRTDIRNAGGDWVDEEVVSDQGIVTSRKPADLFAFVDKIVEEVEEGRHRRRSFGRTLANMLGA